MSESVINPSVSSASPSPARTPEASNTKQAQLRHHRACDACRKMKIKCILPDSAPCQGCRTSGRTCSFLSPGVKRERPPNKNDVETLNSRIQTLERALHFLAPDIDLSSLPRTADQARTMVSSSRSSNPQMTRNRLPSEPSIGNNELESVTGLHRVLQQMSQLHLTPDDFYNEVGPDAIARGPIPNKWEHVNGSGEPDLTYLMHDNQRPIAERYMELHHFRNTSNEQYYPSPDLAVSLVELYFQKIHPYESTLHEGTFRAQYDSNLAQRDCSFRALCYAVFASASRFSSDYRVAPPIEGLSFDRQAAGALYGATSGSLLTPITLPCTLFDLQAMAVLSHFLIGTCSPLTAWFSVGVFLRRAQGDGVALSGSLRWETSIMKDQLRKRAFWSLFRREMQLCLSLGRVSCMKQSPTTISHPLAIDDENLSRFCEDHKCYSLISAYRIAQQSPSIFAATPRCAAKGVMFILQSKINIQLRGLWSLKAVPDAMAWDWDHSLVKQIAQVIDKYITTEIPELARWHPDLISEVDFVVTAHLRCLASYLQILVHRHLIRADRSELKICLAAADNILDTMEHLKLRGLLELTATYTPYLITPAALTFIYSACIEDSCLTTSERANSWADLHRCINILATLASTTFQAEKLKASLDHLVNTCIEEKLFPGSTVFGKVLKRKAPLRTIDESSNVTSCERVPSNSPSESLNLMMNIPPITSSGPDGMSTESQILHNSLKSVELFNITAPQLDASLFQFPGKGHDAQTLEEWPVWLASYDPSPSLSAFDSSFSSQPGPSSASYTHLPTLSNSFATHPPQPLSDERFGSEKYI